MEEKFKNRKNEDENNNSFEQNKKLQHHQDIEPERDPVKPQEEKNSQQ